MPSRSTAWSLRSLVAAPGGPDRVGGRPGGALSGRGGAKAREQGAATDAAVFRAQIWDLWGFDSKAKSYTSGIESA